MRIFNSFLILVAAALLWLIPINDAIYDFQTDVKTDVFGVATAASITSVNLTLTHSVYENDTSTLTVTSSDGDDSPILTAYAATNHTANITGLAENLTRELTLYYDVDALSGSTAWSTILDILPFFWMVLIICFPVAGMAAIFLGRA